MGAFHIDADRVALVRNHELEPKHAASGAFATPAGTGHGFDRGADGGWLPGGTTTLVYNQRTGKVERQHLSLAGTIRNCAGGTTPWGSWLTCEEDVSRAGNGLGEDHGWVFEVPAHHPGRVEALPRRWRSAIPVVPRTAVTGPPRSLPQASGSTRAGSTLPDRTARTTTCACAATKLAQRSSRAAKASISVRARSISAVRREAPRSSARSFATSRPPARGARAKPMHPDVSRFSLNRPTSRC